MLMGPVSRYGLVGIVEDASIPLKGATTADRTKTSPGVFTVLKHKEQILWLPTWGYWPSHEFIIAASRMCSGAGALWATTSRVQKHGCLLCTTIQVVCLELGESISLL